MSKIAEAGARRAYLSLWRPAGSLPTEKAIPRILSQSGLGRAVGALETIIEIADRPAVVSIARTALHHIEHGHD